MLDTKQCLESQPLSPAPGAPVCLGGRAALHLQDDEGLVGVAINELLCLLQHLQGRKVRKRGFRSKAQTDTQTAVCSG